MMIAEIEVYAAYEGILEHFPVQEENMASTAETPAVRDKSHDRVEEGI
jgi:hypothetical protein